jgi:diacylglycerol kinase family enzyme
VSVGNGRYHGGGLKVAENASIDDGRLDLYLIYPGRLWQLATSLIHLKFGTSKPEVLQRLTAVSVSLRTNRPRPVDADGELVTKTLRNLDSIPRR